MKKVPITERQKRISDGLKLSWKQRKQPMIATVTFTESEWSHAANLGENFADWQILSPLKMRYTFTSKGRFSKFCGRVYALGLALQIELTPA